MNNIKKLAYLSFCFCMALVFSACSLGGSSTTSTSSTSTAAVKQVGSFLRSSDGGKSWENKVTIDATKNIGSTNILSMAIDSFDADAIYIGTEKDGLFATRDGGEKWEKLVFPLTKIYGLAIDKNNIYASGVLNKRAKIFKSSDRGQNWTEVYTEPSSNSVISSLEISQKDPRVLYGGTSDGMIFKSTDGGQSWKNLTKASGPVTSISFDAVNDDVVYFGVSGGALFRTLDGGGKIEEVQKKNVITISKKSAFNFNTYSIEVDPKASGTLYAGTDAGIFKGTDFGDKWEEINILESSKKFPVRVIAVNPQNSNEILYSNSGVIYKSVDNGASWLTFQLNTDKTVYMMKYDPVNPNIIYAGLRKF